VVELDDSKSSSSESTSSRKANAVTRTVDPRFAGCHDLTQVAYLHPYHLLHLHSTPQMMQHGKQRCHTTPVESKTIVRGVVIRNVLAVSICLDEAL
jgi:hypothetical protein